jgi:hypothetical protein
MLFKNIAKGHKIFTWFVENQLSNIQLCPASKTVGKCASSSLEFHKFINYVEEYVDVTGMSCPWNRWGINLFTVYCRIH